jgi:hypothetical protein
MKKMTTEEKVLKLKYYAENYEDLIKELNRMSWWGKRKFIKTLKHCLLFIHKNIYLWSVVRKNIDGI